MKPPELLLLHGEESLVLGTDNARLSITLRGGHTCIDLRAEDGSWRSPYSRAPWLPSDFPDNQPTSQILRGDFFCFPFAKTGGGSLMHGEPANRKWSIDSADRGSAVLSMELHEMPGRIVKTLHFDPVYSVLLQEHYIEGVSGDFILGHHPILHVPGGQVAKVSTGGVCNGRVAAGFGNTAAGEVTSLLDGASFDSLESVPTKDGGHSTLAEYPVRERCEDLVMFSAPEGRPAWNALWMPGFLWFSLRDPADFPSTLFWLSNGGRPQKPWNGRHTGRIGIEDLCSRLDRPASAPPAQSLDLGTPRRFSADQPTTFRHVQGVVATELPPARVLSVEHDAARGQFVLDAQGGPRFILPAAWTTPGF